MWKKIRRFSYILFCSIFILTGCSIHADRPIEDASISRELIEEKSYPTNPDSTADIPISADQVQINFVPGTSTYTWALDLSPDKPQTYVLQAHSGQHLFIHRNGNLRIQVYNATNRSVAGPNSQSTPWEVVIPADGTYELAVAGSGKGAISVYFPIPVNSWTPKMTSAPIPDSTQRVSFANGNTTTASTNLSRGHYEGVEFHALAGQQLQVVAKGLTTISLLNQEDSIINPSSASYENWLFYIPISGDYDIVLQGEGVIQLILTLSE